MGEDERVGMRGAGLVHLGDVNRLVGRAEAVVEDHVLLGDLGRDVVTEVHVGDEQDVVLREFAYDLDRVRRGHAHVRKCLHLGRRVHVADDGQVVAISGPSGVHGLPAHHVGHRAVRRGLGHEDRLVGREELRALGHEADPREDDRTTVERSGLATEVERVADVVGEVLRVGRHVVVREDDGAPLLLESTGFLEHLA